MLLDFSDRFVIAKRILEFLMTWGEEGHSKILIDFQILAAGEVEMMRRVYRALYRAFVEWIMLVVLQSLEIFLFHELVRRYLKNQHFRYCQTTIHWLLSIVQNV